MLGGTAESELNKASQLGSCWVGLQNFSAKTFSGGHYRFDQASILAEADSSVGL